MDTTQANTHQVGNTAPTPPTVETFKEAIPPIEATKKKGISGGIVVVLILVLIIGGCVLFYFFFGGDKIVSNLFNPQQGQQQNTEDETERTSEDTEEDDRYAGWKTYPNEEFGLSFKYPSDWLVETTDEGSLLVRYSEEKEGTERDSYVLIIKDENSAYTAREYVENIDEKVSAWNSNLYEQTGDYTSVQDFIFTNARMWGRDVYLYHHVITADVWHWAYVVKIDNDIYEIQYKGVEEDKFGIIDTIEFN